MATPRRQLNATVLPDSTVLITGGSSGAGFNNASAPVYPAERWNPARAIYDPRKRNAISRVPFDCSAAARRACAFVRGRQRAERRSVFAVSVPGRKACRDLVPSTIGYGQSFFVTTPDAASIAAVTLVRLSSVTHSFNMNQRFLRLNFSQGAGGVNVTAPSVAEIAPPGDYMLFLVNGSGVPAVAPIVRLNTGPTPTAPAAPSNLSASRLEQPDQSQLD